jgi:hypothetical protein
LIIKQINGARGVGRLRLMIGAELVGRDAAPDGLALSFKGRLEILGVAGPDVATHLAPLAVLDRDPILRGPGIEDSFMFVADIDDRQVQIIEEHRTGAIRLRFVLPGQVFRDGKLETFQAHTIDHTITQSDWLAILEQGQYARRYLVELDAPRPEADPKLAEAVTYFAQAQRRYGEGDWRQCVENLRQCLAAVVGQSPDDEDEAADVQTALRTAQRSLGDTRVGYEDRAELVRRVLKFFCDLGAHPEVAETNRKQARAALTMTAGLLESLRQA